MACPGLVRLDTRQVPLSIRQDFGGNLLGSRFRVLNLGFHPGALISRISGFKRRFCDLTTLHSHVRCHPQGRCVFSGRDCKRLGFKESEQVQAVDGVDAH